MPPRVAPVDSSLLLVRMLRSPRSRNSSLTLPSSRYRRKIDLTNSASSSTTAILPSLISHPRGRVPPTQRPFRLEAAILSRMRSEVTSLSNWANDRSTLSVSRPIEVVVLNCWVTETNDTPWASNNSTSLAKSANDRVRRSTLYTTMTSSFRARISSSNLCRSGRSVDPPEYRRHHIATGSESSRHGPDSLYRPKLHRTGHRAS